MAVLPRVAALALLHIHPLAWAPQGGLLPEFTGVNNGAKLLHMPAAACSWLGCSGVGLTMLGLRECKAWLSGVYMFLRAGFARVQVGDVLSTVRNHAGVSSVKSGLLLP